MLFRHPSPWMPLSEYDHLYDDHRIILLLRGVVGSNSGAYDENLNKVRQLDDAMFKLRQHVQRFQTHPSQTNTRTPSEELEAGEGPWRSRDPKVYATFENITNTDPKIRELLFGIVTSSSSFGSKASEFENGLWFRDM